MEIRGLRPEVRRQKLEKRIGEKKAGAKKIRRLENEWVRISDLSLFPIILKIQTNSTKLTNSTKERQ